ncbi:MAG: HdeD family acid-resistance protein [Chthoniobacterales bacterium]
MNEETTAGSMKKASGWSMTWGILMFICGILAIWLPLASSLGIVILLAWLILLAGVWHLIFAFHSHSLGGFLWKFLLAALYLVVGIYMLMHPLLSVISLTLVLAVFFVLEGIIEIALYFGLRGLRHAGWVLLDGIITLILGILIWKQWPSSSVWALGTLVGISLIVSGVSRFMLSFATRPA